MLNNALDLGITEFDFWTMTFAELDRLAQSRIRVREIDAKQKAVNDYTLGILIGRAFAGDYPAIEDAYPTIFQKQEIQEKKQEKIDELSAIRFKQFANFHNDKLKGGGK